MTGQPCELKVVHIPPKIAMRRILRNLAVRSHNTTSAQRRNAAALCSRHSQHNTSAAGLSTGRLVCQRHHPASSDGIIRSPFADENFDVVPFADYIFSQANRYGSKIALVSFWLLSFVNCPH